MTWKKLLRAFYDWLIAEGLFLHRAQYFALQRSAFAKYREFIAGPARPTRLNWERKFVFGTKDQSERSSPEQQLPCCCCWSFIVQPCILQKRCYALGLWARCMNWKTGSVWMNSKITYCRFVNRSQLEYLKLFRWQKLIWNIYRKCWAATFQIENPGIVK